MKKKVIVKQHDIKDCGSCSLASIIRYYNGYIPIEQIRLDTKTDINGTTAFNLINAAKKYGFNAYGEKLSEMPSEEKLPAIVHFKYENGLEHFVVLYEIHKNYCLIMDPAKGIVRVNKEEFLLRWTNVILLFKPYKVIPFYNNKYTLKDLLYDLLKEEFPLIKKIIILSLIFTSISILISYFFKIIIASLENNYLTMTLFIAIFFIIINILKIIINYVRNEYIIYLNKDIDYNLNTNFINHIFKLPLDVIKSRTPGEIMTRVNDLNNIKSLFSEILLTIILDFVISLVSIYFLWSISPKLFLILCIIMGLYVICGIIFSPFIYHKINDNINLETEFNSSLVEKISSIESIHNLNILNKVLNELNNTFIEYLRSYHTYNLFLNKVETLKTFIYDIGIFIISVLGILLISNNTLSFVSLITFNSLLNYFIDPIKNTINLIPNYLLIKLSIIKINEFINIKPENSGEVGEFINGCIIYQNVSYSYNDYENIFSNLSLKIDMKSHITIRGHSGSGKSTLVQLLMRRYDNYQGNIYIGNVNIKNYSLNTIRNNIVYISQHEDIFSDTIRNNIVLNKNVSQKLLYAILKITKVDEIINKKSFKLDAILYDSGFNLSGGERQRIILARALIRNPKILILDESLNEVDKQSEKEIINNLDKYFPNMTIIYISHNEVNYFNKVINLEDAYVKL